MILKSRAFGQRYAFVVVAITFVCLLIAAGLRAAPGVLLIPWTEAFGWNRGIISLAIAIGIFLYGLMGPFAAALMLSFGIRRVLITALACMSLATFVSNFMTQPWELILSWGILSGLASGCVAMTLGATIINRWFVTNRGLVMGLLSASTSTGTLIFLPGFALLNDHFGWHAVVLTITIITATLIPFILWLLPERPADAGLVPYGTTYNTPATATVPRSNPIRNSFVTLFRAARNRNFWLLFGTFFVCGLTTNGLVGTHLIALCTDHNISEVHGSTLLAAMGAFDLIGTTASGWLTDRYDSRKLLFIYYAIRGASLIYLPYSNFSFESLSVFSILYGLDWIATVPPTLKLANQIFGDQDAPIIFGWIAAGHQLGAATAALGAGLIRQVEGQYLPAFVVAGAIALIAAAASLAIGRVRMNAAKVA
ncbi:MAG: MFS transporter [Acidocella sp. 20-57-95]|nr:MAG: MFS transporter [Acidocella sp. 20-57-95]OYV59100.1 MAG: MFS transporter [Acidocella sp. 21-58-7]HQT64147.1 MFS transporter [Acidocella sp.]HQU03595.1 MFS transporter [Acidocella sp.]